VVDMARGADDVGHAKILRFPSFDVAQDKFWVLDSAELDCDD
jgi:hypothetical protein